jgi:hypothetical protein
MKNNNNSTKIHTTIDLNQQLAKKKTPVIEHTAPIKTQLNCFAFSFARCGVKLEPRRSVKQQIQNVSRETKKNRTKFQKVRVFAPKWLK